MLPYKNGKKLREGYFDSRGVRYNKWKYYNPHGKLSDIREYVTIDGKETLNQIWYFDDKIDTVIEGNREFNFYGKGSKSFEINLSSHFFHLKWLSNDTVYVNEPVTLLATLITPIYDGNSFSKVFLLDSLTQKEPNIIYNNLETDTINNKLFPSMKPFYSECVLFGAIFTKPGEKKITGYLAEFVNDTLENNEIVEHLVNRIYFDIPVFVKNPDNAN